MWTLNVNTRIVRSAEPVCAETPDGLVMLSVDQAKYYALNETAAEIWRRLENPASVGDLCARISEVFDVEAEKSSPAVISCIENFLQENLITTI